MSQNEPKNTIKHGMFANDLEQHLETMDDDFGIAEGTIAMVPTSVIATVTQFITEHFGECAFETLMEYFPVNASALLDDEAMFKNHAVELVFSKPFDDLIHLLTHLHPDFSKVMDSAIIDAADTPQDEDISPSQLQ